jgi:hypothetical protein
MNYLIAAGGIALLAFLFGGLIHTTISRNKYYDKLYRIKHAETRHYFGSCITPEKGRFFTRVSEHQWVGIIWDKKKKTLIIYTPPDEYERREKFPIERWEPNWKIVSEHQPKPVTVEEYFVRQVM